MCDYCGPISPDLLCRWRQGEPDVPAELREMDIAVMMPHVVSGTNETREAMGELVLANLKAHFCGRPVLTPFLE
jgi:lactate dehydrogenase-like 2-hydroxyacid dehydrogenase